LRRAFFFFFAVYRGCWRVIITIGVPSRGEDITRPQRSLRRNLMGGRRDWIDTLLPSVCIRSIAVLWIQHRGRHNRICGDPTVSSTKRSGLSGCCLLLISPVPSTQVVVQCGQSSRTGRFLPVFCENQRNGGKLGCDGWGNTWVVGTAPAPQRYRFSWCCPKSVPVVRGASTTMKRLGWNMIVHADAHRRSFGTGQVCPDSFDNQVKQ
jgi:hypothetical protein